MINKRISFFRVDTYKEAKLYVSKKRRMYPVVYSEHVEKKKRINPNSAQTDIAVAKNELKIKLEYMTRFKNALRILNQQNDQKEIANLDDSDIEEFECLLDGDEPNVPVNMDDYEPNSSKLASEDDVGDLFVVSAPEPTSITTGVDPVEIDKEFSIEYSYTTDVSFRISFIRCFIFTHSHIYRNGTIGTTYNWI